MGQSVGSIAAGRSYNQIIKRANVKIGSVTLRGGTNATYWERPADPSQGRGATLVIIGGMGIASRMMCQLPAYLQPPPACRVLLMDLPNADAMHVPGSSGSQVTMASLRQHTKQFIDAVGVEGPYDMVGVGHGAQTVCEHVESHGDEIHKLCLISPLLPGLVTGRLDEDVSQGRLYTYATEKEYAGHLVNCGVLEENVLPDFMMKGLVHDRVAHYGTTYWRDAFRSLKQERVAVERGHTTTTRSGQPTAGAGASLARVWAKPIKKHARKTLIVTGANDPYVDRESLGAFTRELGSLGEHIDLPDCGHFHTQGTMRTLLLGGSYDCGRHLYDREDTTYGATVPTVFPKPLTR